MTENEFPVGTRIVPVDGKLFGLYGKGTIVSNPIDFDMYVAVDFDNGNYETNNEYHFVHRSYIRPISPISLGDRVTYDGDIPYGGLSAGMSGTVIYREESTFSWIVEWDRFQSGDKSYPLRHFHSIYEDQLDKIEE